MQLSVAGLLAAIRLWLVSDQPIWVTHHGEFDTTLFVRLAKNLSNGEWLGPYTNRTLIKGPFYPLWITAAHLVGVPVQLSEQLLYVAACAAFVLALRPAFERSGPLLVLYAALLFQPGGYTYQATQGIVREGIYPALTLLTIAGLLALALRATRSLREQIPWAVVLSMSLGALAITREERIWIVLGLVFAAAWTGVRIWRWSLTGLADRGVLWAVVLGAAAVPSLIVCSLNWRYYGVFTVSELDTTEFRAAYGALSRVKPPQLIANVPLTRATREKIYRVSPAFSELQPCFEKGRGRGWANNGPKDEHTRKEVLGGWFVWALRDCVADAGHYGSGRFPADFYRRVAGEVDEACAAARLKCYAKRATLAPVLHASEVAPISRSELRALWRLVTFEECDSRPRPSADGTLMQMYFEMTGGRVFDPARDTSRWKLLEGITLSYRLILPIAAVLALFEYAYETWRVALSREAPPEWMISTTLIAAGGVRVVLLAILEFTWAFPALSPRYLSPVYPLVVAFVTLNVAQWARRAVDGSRKIRGAFAIIHA